MKSLRIFLILINTLLELYLYSVLYLLNYRRLESYITLLIDLYKLTLTLHTLGIVWDLTTS
jgi:hypothetical protein